MTKTLTIPPGGTTEILALEHGRANYQALKDFMKHNDIAFFYPDGRGYMAMVFRSEAACVQFSLTYGEYIRG